MAYRDPVSGRFVKEPELEPEPDDAPDEGGFMSPVAIGYYALAALLLIMGIAYLASQYG